MSTEEAGGEDVINIEGVVLEPDMLVPVEAVPNEVAELAQADAQKASGAAAPEAISESSAEGIDVNETRVHRLKDGEEVVLSVAAFTILGFLKAQSKQKDRWIRRPDNRHGIITALSDRLGRPDTRRSVRNTAVSALNLLAEQEPPLIETQAKEYGPNTRIVNARTTKLGNRVLDELFVVYEPLIPEVDRSVTLITVQAMVSEIEHISELLYEEFPEELQALKDPTAIDPNSLPKTIAELTEILREREEAMDEIISRNIRNIKRKKLTGLLEDFA